MANTVRIRNGMSNATEGDILGNFGDLVGVGVVDKANGHLLVTEDSPRGMSIQVAGGIVYVPNAGYNQLDSDTPKFYPVVCDAEALTIDNNTSGQTRNDIVCVKVDKSIFPDADASNIATKVVVKGTAGGGIPTTPANHYKLAEIEVVNGETEIENSMITDTREQITLQERLINLTASSTTNITGLVGGDGTNIEQVTKPTGDIVGTTDTQTLTNKTLTNPTLNMGDSMPSTNVRARAYLSADQLKLTDDSYNTIRFDTTAYDSGSDYDTTNHYFVCPVTGYYFVGAAIELDNAIADKRYVLRLYNNAVGGSTYAFNGGQTSIASKTFLNLTGVFYFEANDQVALSCYPVSVGGNTVDINGGNSANSYISIHLLST